MKANIRDLLVGIASVVFSICAGIWTVFNYNVEQHKIELEGIFSITEKIELVKLKDFEIKKLNREISRLKSTVTEIEEFNRKKKEMSKKKGEIKSLIFDLLSEIRYRYSQIRKPLLMDKTTWNNNWVELYKYSEKAFFDSFRIWNKHIDKAWEKILKSKDIQIIDKIAKG